jgi:Xaa-Pro aminopeptidase
VSDRIERVRELVAEPLLVTNLVNVRWLTGFESSNAATLIEPDRVRVFADFRYAEQGRNLQGAEFVQTARNLIASLPEHLPGRIAFEADHLTYHGYATLAEAGIALVPTTRLVVGVRATKTAAELDGIRRAAAVTDRVFSRLAREPFAGRTEREVAWRAEELFHEEGAEGLAFPVIVAAGANGANPHTTPGDQMIERGQLVIVDAGARLGGFCSDCTRTFSTGDLPERLREAYEVVLRAQLAALAEIRAGAAGRDVDAVARELIDSTAFAGTFGHGLGHGVGLEVHEAPALRPESEDTLSAGNVVSVEPGVYLPREGGVRIEDLVIVTEEGCEILSPFTKELTEVA